MIKDKQKHVAAKEMPKKPSSQDSLHAFQDILVSLKLKRVQPSTTIDLTDAMGGQEQLQGHLQNLSEAIDKIHKLPSKEMKALVEEGGIYPVKSVIDGTTPFRVKNSLLEPAFAGRSTTVNLSQLEEAVLVLHAFCRLKR